jgi:hypothetical protein
MSQMHAQATYEATLRPAVLTLEERGKKQLGAQLQITSREGGFGFSACCGVWGSELNSRFQGSGGSGFRVQGSGFRVWGLKHVEMVGGLVEQEEVRPDEERPAERDAHPEHTPPLRSVTQSLVATGC